MSASYKDDEIEAIAICYAQICSLPHDAQLRALEWLTERMKHDAYKQRLAEGKKS